MQVTINISLGGSIFHLDEDASLRLQEYLARLEKEFAQESGAAEIISDIESRMAELFRMRLGRYKQVITMADLEEVMATLGTPEAISGGGAASRASRFSVARRFYRDPDRRVLGGVCAGLGAYFSWSPLLFRILFAAMFIAGGFGVALYLVLWIVLPEAKTTAQKLEMRGDPITIATIKESVLGELASVKKKISL